MNISLVAPEDVSMHSAWEDKPVSPKVDKLFIAPEMPEQQTVGINVAMSATDFPKIKEFVLANQVAMVVVGPEDPLVKGIYDYFKKDAELRLFRVIGPSKVGAQLEGSKDFAKAFMMRHHIPTARYKSIPLKRSKSKTSRRGATCGVPGTGWAVCMPSSPHRRATLRQQYQTATAGWKQKYIQVKTSKNWLKYNQYRFITTKWDNIVINDFEKKIKYRFH